MEINFVAGKFPKAIVAVLLAACFSFESLALAVAAPPKAFAPSLTQAAWQRLNAREDNFSVMVPARPEITGNREFTFGSNGEFITEERIASAYHNGVVYLVRMFDTSNPKRLLSKYPAIRQISPAVESNVSAGGIEGKQLVKKNEGFVHLIRLYPTKKRLYVLEAAARDENNADIRHFFSSLTLGDPAATVSDKTDPAAGSANASAAPLPSALDLAPLTEKEVTHPAVLIYKPQPPYTARAKQLGVSGTLKFRVVFSPSGEVTDIKVTQGLGGGLSEAVTPIVKSIKFLPAVKDGRLVPQYAEISYNFVLR